MIGPPVCRTSSRRSAPDQLDPALVEAGFLEDGAVDPSEQGTPQGGSISVLLSNVYLHHVRDLWFERVVRAGCEAKPDWCATSTTLRSVPISIGRHPRTGGCTHQQCCEPTAEERSALNPRATFCGSGRRATAFRDPVRAQQQQPYRNPSPRADWHDHRWIAI